MNSDVSSSFRKGVLNPNAREFVPITKTNAIYETKPLTASRNGKTSSQKVGSPDLCSSEEESRRFWDAQLPDDILSLDTDVLVESTLASAYCNSLLTGILNHHNADGPHRDRTISGNHMQTLLGIAKNNYPDSEETSINPVRQMWENNQVLPSQPLDIMPIGWKCQHANSENEVAHIASVIEKQHLCRENGLMLFPHLLPSLQIFPP